MLVLAALLPIAVVLVGIAMDFAACIGCGACVAACPNGAAQLLTGAKVAHLAALPQGAVQRGDRTTAMVAEMESTFGSCTNYGECVRVCPAGIPLTAIASLNREVLRGVIRGRRAAAGR